MGTELDFIMPEEKMTKYWIGVASREHVKQGEKEGIAQVCHGKGAPLKRMKPRDWIIYYSPTQIYGDKTLVPYIYCDWPDCQ